MASPTRQDASGSTVRRAVTCCCIVLNCLTVGSSYCFPLYGPVLTKRMGLTMSETNAISLAIILGQYASALVIGAVADKSCRSSALLGSVLFSSGYSMMAISLSRDIPPSYTFFVAYFLLVGAGTVSSYFAALTAAAKSFPSHPGLAIGIPSALFGISPLLLSSIASALFTRKDGEDSGDIDPVKLFTFLAVLLGVVNVISAIGLRPPAPPPRPAQGSDSDVSVTGEQTALLPSAATKPIHLDIRSFMKQSSVWVFLLIVLFLNGPSEVISQNLGSMSEFLIPAASTSWPDHATLLSRQRQIQIFSLTNTFSRLGFGALSDFTCPSLRSNSTGSSKRWTTPRLTYLQFSAVLLCVACIFTATMLNSLDYLWVLSAASGLSYGTVNVVGPSLVSKVYGEADFGRNFGILWSIAAAGPLFFGLLYGSVSDHFAKSQGTAACKGRVCFSITFLVIAAGAVLAFLLTTVLKRRKSWSRV